MSNLKITVEELDSLLANYPEDLEIIKTIPDLQSRLDRLEQPPEIWATSEEQQKRCMLAGLRIANHSWPKDWT